MTGTHPMLPGHLSQGLETSLLRRFFIGFFTFHHLPLLLA